MYTLHRIPSADRHKKRKKNDEISDLLGWNNRSARKGLPLYHRIQIHSSHIRFFASYVGNDLNCDDHVNRVNYGKHRKNWSKPSKC